VDIADWLQSLDMQQYEEAFRDNAIDAAVLPELTADDLKDLGVNLVGHRRRLLAAIAALRSGDRLARAVPADQAAPTSAAERRQLTVMFCDLVGSTPLSARLDPEDLRGVIGAYHRCVTEIVQGLGGFVARYMGDGVLVYFGYPHAHEDDAERATRCGLVLVNRMPQLNRAAELHARVGIATGLVVVGGEVVEHDVAGDTPNLAARLQAAAEPDNVVIAASTRRLTGNLFEYRDLGDIELKGIVGPVSAWQVLRPSAIASRFEAMHGSALTPLVGRDEELDLLLRRWRQAKSGKGSTVLISGEPGIGKSRLIVELEQRIATEPHVSLRYFCTPHYRDSPLHPIIARWEQAAGFVRGDGSEEKLLKLEAMLLPSGTSAEDLALIADLLSVPTDERYPKLEYSPQRKKQKMFEALNRRLADLARTDLVLLLFEDAHWADPSTLELLETTMDRLTELPALLVVSFRPEFTAPWIGRAGVSLTALSRLDRRQSAELAARVTLAHALPAALLDRIVAQTDGVPLFIEELTKAVLETTARPDGAMLAVPDTLQASLMARLDRLPAAKAVAQIGAVIGRSFSYELIAALAEIPEPALREGLGQLVGSDLAFERGVLPDAGYTFKHALVQDAAYDSLLRSRRAALHARVVEVLRAREPEIEESRPDLLAHHCEHAGLVERAVEYYTRAGLQSHRRAAFTEARELLTTALRLIATVSDGPARVEAELRALTGLGATLALGFGPGASEYGRVASREAELYARLPNPLDFLRVPFDIWQFHLVRCDFTSALSESERLVRLAEERGDVRGRIVGHIFAGSTKSSLGELVAARSHLELAMSVLESCYADPTVVWDPARSVAREHALALAHIFLARVLCFMGYPDQARASASAAVEGSERRGFMGHVAHFGMMRLRILQYLLEPSELVEPLAEALRLSREFAMPSHTATARIHEGYVIANRDDPRAGGAAIREGLADLAATETVSNFGYNRALLAETYQMQGNSDEALGILTEALSHTEQTGERWCEAELIRRVGQTHRLKGNRDAAESYFAQAIDIARRQSAKLFELRAAVSLARLWSEQGKRAEARELLAPIYAWFTEGFDTSDLKQARALLAELGK
jgi:class 3 adenylate cyclase/predicted ATPase